jgi:hypothetical protein
MRLAERREYFIEPELKNSTELVAHKLFIKLQAFRNALK